MQTPKKLVIVGCGMAAGKLVDTLLNRAPSRFSIAVMGKEPEGNYDRIQLSAILKGEPESDFILHSNEHLASLGIEAHLGETATALDLEARTVTGDKGTVLSFDTLVLATGSSALVPPMEGAETDGVFVLRNLADTRALSAHLADKSTVTVMGGGILGLELADTLLEMGKSVTVSHLMPNLMEQQLASDAASALEKRLTALGIAVEKENPVIRVEKLESGLQLTRKDGTKTETDTLVINCGIVPETAFAKAAGLDVRRGIVVNEHLRTSHPSVYAVGECAEIEEKCAGLLAPVYAQAECLAAVLTGDEEAAYHPGPDPAVKLKSRIPVMAVGDRELGPEDTAVVYDNPASSIYKRLILRDNRLAGASLVGDDLNGDAVAGYCVSKLPLPAHLEALLFPGVKTAEEVVQAVYWPGNVMVCDCNNVSCDTIRNAIRTVGRDLKRISETTGAARSCGTCLSRVAAIAENTYDAIVVGAGLGGLTAGANLSKHGLRVLVLEQHDKPGGYASCFERDGYTFDASLHNLGPMNNSTLRIFENLGLKDRVEYLPYDHFQRVVFPEHDFVIPKGTPALEAYLSEQFPAEKDGIRGLFAAMRHVRQGFEEIEGITLDADTEEPLSPLMAAKYPEFAEWTMTSLDELMSEHVRDPKLKALVGNIWWYLGLPPSEMPALLYSVVGFGYMEYAGGYVRGTSQQLSNALVEKIEQGGGRVQLRTKVARILVSDGKADGVITESGEMFYTDLVLSNAGGYLTFSDLMEETDVPKKYRKKVNRQDNALSAVQLYLGLDCPPEALGIEGHSFTAFSSYDHDENYRFIEEGAYDKSFFSCMVYSALDNTLAPPGKTVLHLFSLDHMQNWEGLSQREYEKKKAAVTAMILKKAEKHIPGLSKHIVVSELGTPRTMQRYTGHKEGSIYGPSQSIYQSGLNRLQAETPIDGLYLVGSAIYPGGGYPSVLNSGYRTAHAILRKRKG